MENDFKRSNRNLQKKLLQYMIPTMITYTALSLNEFADSMIVSNLLGSNAMAIVSLGMPVTLIMTAVYNLLGSGGSTLYAISLGERDHETAGKSLTAALVIGLAAGLALMAAGYLFFGQITRALCRDAALLSDFRTYMRIILLSTPLLIPILIFVTFLPAAGYPEYSTVVSVIANVVNIGMDVVYIRLLGMGIEGAGWATLTGYVVAMLIVCVLILRRKISMHISRNIKDAMSILRDVFSRGAPDAITQLGFSLQFAVSNSLATGVAGTAGIVAFSLCIQSNSVVSIFVGALMGSFVPVLSVLHGQKDYSGEAGLLRSVMRGQLLISLVLFVLLEVFAAPIAALYNITDATQAALAVRALRIYSVKYLLRSGVIMYVRYLTVIGFSRYASVISALDGFALTIPVSWIMCRLFGTDGLWISFALTSLILIAIMLIVNRRIEMNSGGRLKGLLLYECDEDSKPVLDVTITDDASSISGISRKLQEACEAGGLSKKDAVKAALAVEEMAVYASNKKDQNAHMDIIVRLSGDEVMIDFRSLGAYFDPIRDAEEDMPENVRVLRGIASEIKNDYMIGMNSTRIILRPSGH